MLSAEINGIFPSRLTTLSTADFYRDIKALALPVADAMQSRNFTDVPPEWVVVIADVQNSTAAVAAGRHNDVNLVAAGSLVAILNIAKEKNTEIPFFFSGDGGAALVPASMEADVLRGLSLHNENVNRNFGLNMHVGSLSVADIVASGMYIKIAKAELGQSFHKPLVLGDGMKYAERKIKLATKKEAIQPDNKEDTLNMSGLECRWDKVKPPGNENENEIVCYLIEAREQYGQAEVYHDVLVKMDETYGSLERRNPLSVNRLKLLLNLNKLEKEMRIRYQHWNFRYFISAFLETLLGLFFFRFNLKIGPVRGRDYLSQLIANADTLTIDGRINTILSGKAENREQLLSYLTKKENEGVLVFGHHLSKESVMTCYIENMHAKHIHFVDGSDGGYTEAARELKQKLSAIRV